MSPQQISRIFTHLKNTFGFQHDSMHNMYDHLMVMLDSRSSRMPSDVALKSLHAEYIGGPHANYRKWYFAVQLDLDEAVGDQHAATHVAEENGASQQAVLQLAEKQWQTSMENLTHTDRIQQLALWLLIWAEASVIRFCPEALCFLFKCAKDYYNPQMTETAPEGDYLDTIITPLYNFIRDQSYTLKDGQYVKRERDHADTIGYDDVNQLFWYPTCLNRLRLEDKKTRLMDLPPAERYPALRSVRWQKAFQKTFKEKRSWMHIAVNFTRIWIIHIVAFWYYIAANADSVYLSSDKEEAEKETPVKLSIVALGGGVATLLVMLACLVEYVYVPMTWRRAGILSRRLLFLFPILLLNVGPSVYCVYFDRTSPIATAVSVVQLLISLATSVFFAIIPQSRLFVRFRKQDARKTMASQTFTANFPHLKRMDRLISIGIWACVFGCKFLESYFFLALSFKDPLTVMAQMRVQNCRDPIVGTALCTYMPAIALIFMFLMDLVLFFLDTYLWYIIWNTVFSVARSFYLGISIWTPWRNIFSRLPKRIYAKILATSELELTYKPKFLCSQIWNAFVISMYREHLLSADHVAKLLYQQVCVIVRYFF